MRKTKFIGLTLCLVTSAFFFSTQAQVQEVRENTGAVAAWRALLRLRTTATVLHTTAHPDDEDAALLTWLSRHVGARTGLLTLNRGEGGANLVGPELYDALGVLRTEEMLAAGRLYGLDAQMFTRVTDFGFSKRLDETLEHWGKEVVLGDVVRAIRRYRPDIIISRFHGAARDGHGNHQAAGLLTREAFKAAADLNRFPEQLKEGLEPWQAKKLYLSTRGNEPHTLRINTGVFDPLLGRSYRQLASEGYGMHRSQSMGQPRVAAGDMFSTVQLLESTLLKTEPEASLFDGFDTTLAGLAQQHLAAVDLRPELREVTRHIEQAVRQFNARAPWDIVPELVAGRRALRKAIEKAQAAKSGASASSHDGLIFRLSNKDDEFMDAVNKALCLSLDVVAEPDTSAGGNPQFQAPRETFKTAIPGQQFKLTASLVNPSPVKFERAEMVVVTAHRQTVAWEIKPLGEVAQTPKANELTRYRFEIKVPEKAVYTRPYWSRASELRDHAYAWDNPEMPGIPFAPPDLAGVFDYVIEGMHFRLPRPAQTAFVASPFGEQRRLLTVTPALNVQLAPRVAILPLNTTQAQFNVQVSLSSNVKGAAQGQVKLRLPAGWQSVPVAQPFRFTHEGELANFSFTVSVPRVATGQEYKVQAVAEYNNQEYTEGYEVIAHRDNEPRHLYRPATMTVRGIETNVAPNLTVGYVMGVGDEIPKALEQIGVKVTLLNENDLVKGNLDGYDAILVGIRATAVRHDLKAYSKRLLEYCERGGNLVYQYQTQEFDAAPYGPYPYKLGARAEEVSEEDSKVTLLAPANPIFNWPNKIDAADFNGWVEERGSKWMSTWDERYVPLLECHDREQSPQKGGLMYAPYGKGTFVYAAYAFYRQLSAGVQGGYRLFANIISLKKRPQ